MLSIPPVLVLLAFRPIPHARDRLICLAHAADIGVPAQTPTGVRSIMERLGPRQQGWRSDFCEFADI
jgi:hypothetical protein